ncbi:histidine phosphatase family protein [Carnobacteriaceae bacterium zg-ZUI252]|nr:histidine phosphatase family protein [Carnobacteriaceae bacterium zg-ZUI252]MBS4770194.1 histidine phosphatase family protein [Carnobacteriaceae bacterium zg-ZUI240]
MRKTIYLTRHGQTIFNVENRTQGSSDSPLTPLGIEQAQKVRDFFIEKGITFDAVYSSTQERACDTAEIMSGGMPYTRLKGLKEWDFGVFEAYPEHLKNGVRDPKKLSYEDSLVAFGGESRQSVGERMERALCDIAESKGDTILAVSHGGAMWAFALTANIDRIPKPPYPNCCVMHLEYEDGQFYFIELIDVLNANVKYDILER